MKTFVNILFAIAVSSFVASICGIVMYNVYEELPAYYVLTGAEIGGVLSSTITLLFKD